MATITSILSDTSTLSASDRILLKDRLVRMFTQHTSSLDKFVKTERFSGGLVCPLCGCTHIVRHGNRKDGTQRYLCRDCGKTFVAATNTIASYTKKDLSVWEKYIDCMMNGFSLRKTAFLCGIHKSTAFLWRHKILDTL